MLGIGLTLRYNLGDGERTSTITGWQNHPTWDEIYMQNGDTVVDTQIIEWVEDRIYEAQRSDSESHSK